MTEAEWLAATDPTPMLEFLRGKTSDRKLRLFAVAALRVGQDNDPETITRIEVAERFADGRATVDDLRRWWKDDSGEGRPERAYSWSFLVATWWRPLPHDPADPS